MLFPMYTEEDSFFPFEIWDWWREHILGVGAYHRVFSREGWEGQPAYWRGATVILWRDEQMADVESFLREARETFGQTIYFEATNVHVRLI